VADVQVIELEYESMLISLYQRLADLEGFVLLESIDKTMGQFDIVSACPYLWLKTTSHGTTLSDDKSHWHEKGDAFEILNKYLPKTKPIDGVPFVGGAIGYFAYELNHALEDIPSSGTLDYPLMIQGIYDWAIIANHKSKWLKLVALNHDSKTKDIVLKVIGRLKQNKEGQNTSFWLESELLATCSRAKYQHAFDKIKTYLRKGRCYQVNLTQQFTSSFKGNPWLAYLLLRHHNRVPYAAFMQFKEVALASFSPELFLHHSKKQITTKPIKGTIRRHHDNSLDLLRKQSLNQCPKNRAENIMIVDLLRNDLGKIALAGSVNVNKLCELETHARVHHLVSTIKAKTNAKAIDIFKACFPGGSITGAPKIEAMKIISELECTPRGIYCGSLAYLSADGQMQSNIAIRTLVAAGNTLRLSAGGGIVIDSECGDEYQESLDKIASFIQPLSRYVKPNTTITSPTIY
jgi:para-aminobenzoate synthetase component I